MSMLLEARGITVRYGQVVALQDVSLRLAQGSIVTVIGPNGAGKTTLLNALMAMVPSSGEVIYAGERIERLPVAARVAKRMSLVPERGQLFGELAVHDNLALGAYARFSLGERGFEKDMERLYRRFPALARRRAQPAGTLSGGERQMLALARALMARPRLLMLDEPSLGLAPLMVREILRAIRELKDEGVSVLLVEQNARAALEIADYGYVLETGAVSLHGSASELARDERVIETYLGLDRSVR